MERAKYIKTFYDKGKYTKYYFRKVQVYEYKGYEYYIYPDATFLCGYELYQQHKDEQYRIDEQIKVIEHNHYREQHPEEFKNEKTCEQALDEFFKFLDEE